VGEAGATEFSTRAAGGSDPLGLVMAELFLVLFVWGYEEREDSIRGRRDTHFPSQS
jgi:hypothetical protein